MQCFSRIRLPEQLRVKCLIDTGGLSVILTLGNWGITRVFEDVSVFTKFSFLVGIDEVVERSFFENAAF